MVKVTANKICEARKDLKDGKKGSADGVEVQDIKILGPIALERLARIYTDYCLPEGSSNK